MSKTPEEQQIELLDHIRRLLMLSLKQQGIQGKQMAEVMGVDPAVVSRILAASRKK
jgi:predicted transcriptional regulator